MADTIFQDFRTNADGDLYFDPSYGDFQIAPSDNQHIDDILMAHPGDWKQNPEVGVGVPSYISSDGQEQKLSREIIIQLKRDGYVVGSPIISISRDTIDIQPNAHR